MSTTAETMEREALQDSDRSFFRKISIIAIICSIYNTICNCLAKPKREKGERHRQTPPSLVAPPSSDMMTLQNEVQRRRKLRFAERETVWEVIAKLWNELPMEIIDYLIVSPYEEMILGSQWKDMRSTLEENILSKFQILFSMAGCIVSVLAAAISKSSSSEILVNDKTLLHFALGCCFTSFILWLYVILLSLDRRGFAARTTIGLASTATACGILAVMGMFLPDEYKLRGTAAACLISLPALIGYAMKRTELMTSSAKSLSEMEEMYLNYLEPPWPPVDPILQHELFHVNEDGRDTMPSNNNPADMETSEIHLAAVDTGEIHLAA